MYNTARYGTTQVSTELGAAGDGVQIMEINKDLIAASSTPIVLAILTEGDSYGYAILQRVRELSAGRMEWTDGMLYPVLHRLERQGYVEARWEVAENGRRRKYYGVTRAGREQLAEERRQWQAVDATLRGIWRSMTEPIPAAQPAPVGAWTGAWTGAWAIACAAIHATVHAVRHGGIRPSLTGPLLRGA